MSRRSLTTTCALSLAAAAFLAGCPSNKPPDAPVLTGPAQGQAGVNLEFRVSAVDPDDDSVSCRVAWGDGDTSGWGQSMPSGRKVALTHSWTLSDTYTISSQARDERGNESPWSSGLELVVLPVVTNDPPSTPNLSGPDSGHMRETLAYAIVAADPESDTVAYRIAWGDGDTSEWSQNVGSGESLVLSHSWSATGTYSIMGQAKDQSGHRSGWSAGLPLSVQTPEYPGTVVAKVTVGSDAFGPCATPDGQYLYVANYTDNTVSVVRTSDNTEMRRFILNGRPSLCVPSRDGQYVYISCSSESAVARIRVSDNTLAGRIATPHDPWEMATSPDGNYLYAGIFRSASFDVAVLSLADDSVIATPEVGYNPWGMAITPDGARLYVACRDEDKVSVLQIADSSVVATIPVGAAPNGLTMSPDGQLAYVVAESSGAVYVISTTDNSVIDSVAIPDRPTGIAVLPNGQYLYVASYDSDYVSVIRTSDYAVVKQVSVGGMPDRIAVSPDGSRVYVVTRAEGRIAVIGY